MNLAPGAIWLHERHDNARSLTQIPSYHAHGRRVEREQAQFVSPARSIQPSTASQTAHPSTIYVLRLLQSMARFSLSYNLLCRMAYQHSPLGKRHPT